MLSGSCRVVSCVFFASWIRLILTGEFATVPLCTLPESFIFAIRSSVPTTTIQYKF